MRSFGLLRALAAGLAACLLSAICGCSSPGPDVLLVSIDSLRADRLGAYGNPRATSPNFDRLVRQGVQFEEAWSSTSWTLPAHVTLLTGQQQESHHVVGVHDRITDRNQVLAERFKAAGFETLGIFSGPFLDPVYGFDRGFDHYVSCVSPRTAALRGLAAQESAVRDRTNGAVREAFARWLDGRSDRRRFFAFVHLWDVHHDYHPPREYAEAFDPDYQGPLDGTRIAGPGFPLDAPPRDVEHLFALYDAEVRDTDETVGRLLQGLHRAGLLERTIVSVTADHGDEFLEHGGKRHQHTLYEELIRIPLVLRAPREVPAGRTVSSPVSLADVAPTLLDLARVSPLGQADGRSLRTLWRGERADSRRLSAVLYDPVRQGVRLVTVRDGRLKLIYHPTQKRYESYDLWDDPGEQGLDPQAFEQLRSEIDEYAERVAEVDAQRGAREEDAELPEELRERLEELGYATR